MDFRKFASGFFVVRNLLGSSFSLSTSADGPCEKMVTAELPSNNGTASVGNASNCLDKINSFFCNCAKKVKIENEKLAEALGWFGAGVVAESAAIGLVKGICALSSIGKKGNEVKGGGAFDITAHATVTLKGKGVNAKKDVKYSKSDIKSKESSCDARGSISSSGDRAVDGANKVGDLGSNGDILKVGSGRLTSSEGSSKFGFNSYKGSSSSKFVSGGVVVSRFSSSRSCCYPNKNNGFSVYIRGCR